MLLLFVFMPSLYLFTYIFSRWNEIYVTVFAHPIIGNQYWTEIVRALNLSFRLSLTTVAIDLVIGIPLAYLLGKKDFPGKSLIEDLTILPLVIPTSGFGFATMIAWTASYGLAALLGLRVGVDTVVPLVNIPLIMLIVHVALTFPYIVNTVVGALKDLSASFEIVSSSLGAHPVTTFRKVTFPLILPSILSGSVLAFARSLGETGATMIVSGVSTTASIAIVRWEFENKLAPAAFLGAILVGVSMILIVPIEYALGGTIKGRRIIPLSVESFIVKLEKSIPRKMSWLRDIVSIFFLSIIILMPIAVLLYNTVIYWSCDPYTGRVEGGILYQLFGPSDYYSSIVSSIITSLLVASIATLISALVGVLAVLLMAHSRFGRFIKVLLKVPLVVPTSALGLSMVLLWGPHGIGVVDPGFWLIVLTHVVFSVPVITETGMASYIEGNLPLYESTARTLGAGYYDVAETITLPLVKRGVLAGSLLAFTN